MNYKKIKSNFIYIMLMIFISINTYLVGQTIPYKNYVSAGVFLITMLSIFFNKDRAKEIFHYFIFLNNDKSVKKISGGLSFFSWVFFFSSSFLLNMGFLWPARWFLLMFVITVIVNTVLVLYDLWCENDIVLKKSKPLFFSGASILYFITSAYSASYFLEYSNMNISDSPLLELGWKSAFFSIWFFVILQPISFLFFLYATKNFKGHKVISSMSILLMASILSFAVLSWAENFVVFSLDWATKKEWRTYAMCGTSKISEPTERYYGFNTEKYTVYFSNRNGEWGFEEMNCIKDDKNHDAIRRTIISHSKMPEWFKK